MLKEKIHYRPGKDSNKITLSVALHDVVLSVSGNFLFTVDTGSDFVVASASLLGLSKNASMGIQRTCQRRDLRCVDNQFISSYTCKVAELGVGRLVFRNFPVHISFDSNMKKMLLGMTFLKMFYTTINPVAKTISFEAPHITERVIREHWDVPGLDSWTMPSSDAYDLDYLEQLSTAQESPEAALKGGEVTKLKLF